jgi:hypothetical protein
MSTKRMKEEHQKCCEAMRMLMQEGRDSGCNGPLPEKKALYMRLSMIQDVLEWCDSSLLQAGELECATRIETLMSCSKYYGLGPTDTELSQGR